MPTNPDTNPEPTVQLLRTAGASAYIVALARSLPCLKHKVERLFPPGTAWDIDVFMKASGPWSHGEKLCALFVANVYNPGYADSNEWRFDLFEFLGTADLGNRRALLAWVANPVWP